jgi:hypothetical protein
LRIIDVSETDVSDLIKYNLTKLKKKYSLMTINYYGFRCVNMRVFVLYFLIIFTISYSAQTVGLRFLQNRLIETDQLQFENGLSNSFGLSTQTFGFKIGAKSYEWWYIHLDVFGSVNIPVIADGIIGRLSSVQFECAPIGYDILSNQEWVSLPVFSTLTLGNVGLRDVGKYQFNPSSQIGVHGGLFLFLGKLSLSATYGVKYDFSA